MEKAFALQVIRRGNTAIALVDEVGFQPRLEFERYIKRLILSPVKPKNPMCGNGDLYRFISFLRFSFFFLFSASQYQDSMVIFHFRVPPLMNYGLLTFLSTFAELSREKNCSCNLDMDSFDSLKKKKNLRILNYHVRSVYN